MTKVIVFGTIALDDIKTPFGKVTSVPGGSALYASIACSFFSNVGILSAVGNDFPEKEKKFLQNKKISLDGLENFSGKTFHWAGYYDLDINNAITLKTDLNIIKKYYPKVPDEYKNTDFLFLANMDPELQLEVLKQFKKKPKFVVSDTMNLWISKKRKKVLEIVKISDIALMNDSEARQLFKTSNLAVAAKEILKLDSKIAIIKKGEHGCVAFTKKTFFSCPGYPLENIVDPTGSGDCFGGALIGYLAKTEDFSEKNIRKAIVYGSCIASFNAEAFSTEKLKKISLKEINKRYKEFSNFVKF
ncbi:MAG: PfkB family carbohydrate kinase [Candidatus Diapherotrites archaeon]